jgi:hypothetical protein
MSRVSRSDVDASDERPKIAVVAHRVDDSGGMERVHAELVRRLLDRYRFIIVASNVAHDLREQVEWWRVPLPSGPAPLRFLLFYGLGAIQLRRARADLVHACGALVPNRADVASVHFCHAGFVAASGRLAPEGTPLLRRLNTSLQRGLAIGAERCPTRLPKNFARRTRMSQFRRHATESISTGFALTPRFTGPCGRSWEQTMGRRSLSSWAETGIARASPLRSTRWPSPAPPPPS